jgi:hypothetical protein
MNKTKDGFFRVLNLRQLERRANEAHDPRWIFYSAMLCASSVAEYRSLVGEVVVYPSTYHGKVSAENELRYVVNSRRWLAIVQAEDSQSGKEFVPDPSRDERVKTLREIILRQGQQKFRRDLLEAYEAKCALSGCPITALLDAAHITPHLGRYTNQTPNGILLRTDLHTLWDLSMLAIEPTTMRIHVAMSVRSQDERYAALHGGLMRLPESISALPSELALASQWQEFCIATNQ